MSQESPILIVDLPEKAPAFIKALAQVGRSARSIQVEELASAFEHLRPIAVVAPFDQQRAIAEEIRANNPEFQFPVFVLEESAAGSLRPLLPEITARLPDDVDPGILAMRLQIALQGAGSAPSRRPTVVGIPSISPSSLPPASLPQGLSSAPAATSEPPRSRVSAPATTPGLSPSASPASSLPSQSSPFGVEASNPLESHAPAASDAPTAAPPEAAVLSSSGAAAFQSGSSEAAPTEDAPDTASATSTPPSSFSTPPSSFSTPPAVTPTDPGGEGGEAAFGQAQSPGVGAGDSLSFGDAVGSTTDSLVPAPVARPVAATDPDLTALQGAGAARQKALRMGGIAAGALALVGIAVAVFSGGDESDKAPSAELAAAPGSKTSAAAPTDRAAPTKPAAAPAPTPKKAADGADSIAPATPPKESGQAGLPAPDGTSNADSADGGDELFKVEGAIAGESCENILGHPQQYFAKTAKWRASNAWKLARKNLLAGKQEAALEQMCRAAFIDPRGPATAGLVKFYLGQRALEQALIWAKVAVEEKPGGAAGRAAQQLVGDVLSQMGNLEEAKKTWLESFGLREDEGSRLDAVCRSFVTSAQKARKGGDTPLAERLLRRAAAFQPKDAAIAADLARALLDNEQQTLAKRWAQRALELDASSDTAKAVLAQL